ncbi:hypothetical protein [Pelagibius sp. Alg239-R121]|uniref:hypothetical protein n=1 Tax=Pelagibius sp. Alg239-R121 TaxID=2993448 RepID=UPI0024A73D87|nr:hypothetical protein [Pelagibius sp. Alg239-R121]
MSLLADRPRRWACLQVMAAGIAIAVLSGCDAKSIDTNFAFTPETKTGLIIGSASSSREYSRYAATVRFLYAKAGQQSSARQQNTGFIQSLPVDPLTLKPGSSELTGTDGTLFAISLTPGNYILEGWNIDSGTDAVVRPPDPKPLTFQVHQGKATYIGNLHMFVRIGQSPQGVTVISGAQPVIIDKSERDIPLLLQRYRNIKREDIEVYIIDDRPWGGLGPPERLEVKLGRQIGRSPELR